MRGRMSDGVCVREGMGLIVGVCGGEAWVVDGRGGGDVGEVEGRKGGREEMLEG